MGNNFPDEETYNVARMASKAARRKARLRLAALIMQRSPGQLEPDTCGPRQSDAQVILGNAAAPSLVNSPNTIEKEYDLGPQWAARSGITREALIR